MARGADQVALFHAGRGDDVADAGALSDQGDTSRPARIVFDGHHAFHQRSAFLGTGADRVDPAVLLFVSTTASAHHDLTCKRLIQSGFIIFQSFYLLDRVECS